ncbi:TetR/AcrR family transcriptional regulator [Pollutimonas bauzanensis]|uniref:Transcriptional regulator, TetR family n=1 Tax=Pollutimonas bauzanensis TaxID=658167 RepID=A0A1M5WZ69_9BURK|nr:TetR/AcrR family transcriptional regulator [Pollutimonas bauzanensis]SHH92821.1 transcriptional regulator, TetR family [Pollutimonas bauzanensis]
MMVEETRKASSRAGRPSSKASTRERLIQVGTEVLSERGFSSTGIDEILLRARAPKGVFYYYFASKQEFGLAVIANYEQVWDQRLERIFSNPQASPLQRLRNYIEEGMHGMEKYSFKRGCLIGNLGQELGSLNDAFRQRIELVFINWALCIKTCLDEAIAMGEVRDDLDTTEIARYFWTGWEGAILQCKLARSVRPLEDFSRILFKYILGKGNANVQ